MDITDPITSVQIYCAQCKHTTRAQGGLTAALVLGIVERCESQGHEVEVQIPAPSGSLADKFEHINGLGTISGRW